MNVVPDKEFAALLEMISKLDEGILIKKEIIRTSIERFIQDGKDFHLQLIITKKNAINADMKNLLEEEYLIMENHKNLVSAGKFSPMLVL
jgi:hypothetical protein